jgi:hypothetical protein
MPKLVERDYGFSWGPATVTRLFSTEKGDVWLEIASNRWKETLQIHITPTGFIRAGQPNKNQPKKRKTK